MDATTIHGWVPEPDGRGTWSILWSCLVTISICTWSALHLNVPKPRHSWSSLIVRQVMWMLAAATAPEYILWTSANDYFRARKTLRYLTLKQKQQDWTMTHMLFAFAGGFWVRTPNRRESKCRPKQLLDLIINGSIDGPPISQDELKSRAKGDWTVKLIAILQIFWFLIQILARAAQHYHITSLEILTAAFVLCSIFIYAFSFQKPQDVEFPVFIEIPDALHDITEPNLAKDSNESGTMLYNVARALPEHSTKKEDFDPDTSGSLRVLALLGCVFGTIHCLAWNSPFPTTQERLAWRVCSAATVAIPGLAILTLMCSFHAILCIACFCKPGEFLVKNFGHIMNFYHLLGLAYILGRITLVVLAFVGLRALPADAFRTVDWNTYFPHFAN
ncbi:hypothetical protein MMC13_008085 [Lambiella insularis]|nr:hypothetical protein [Lambiella insularis]